MDYQTKILVRKLLKNDKITDQMIDFAYNLSRKFYTKEQERIGFVLGFLNI